MTKISFSGKKILFDNNKLFTYNGISNFHIIIYPLLLLLASIVYFYFNEIFGIAMALFLVVSFLRESTAKISLIDFNENIFVSHKSFLGFNFSSLEYKFDKLELSMMKLFKGGGDGTHTKVYYELGIKMTTVDNKKSKIDLIEMQRKKHAFELLAFLNKIKVLFSTNLILNE